PSPRVSSLVRFFSVPSVFPSVTSVVILCLCRSVFLCALWLSSVTSVVSFCFCRSVFLSVLRACPPSCWAGLCGKGSSLCFSALQPKPLPLAGQEITRLVTCFNSLDASISAAIVSPKQNPPPAIRGFLPALAQAQPDLEQKFQAIPTPARAEANLR